MDSRASLKVTRDMESGRKATDLCIGNGHQKPKASLSSEISTIGKEDNTNAKRYTYSDPELIWTMDLRN